MCPRSALKKVLDAVESKYGITFVIGHEIEFYLLEERLLEEPGRKRLPAPIDTSLYCQTSALDGAATLIDDICDAVEACSIPVEQVHSESGPGQFELAAAPGIGISCSHASLSQPPPLVEMVLAYFSSLRWRLQPASYPPIPMLPSLNSPPPSGGL